MGKEMEMQREIKKMAQKRRNGGRMVKMGYNKLTIAGVEGREWI